MSDVKQTWLDDRLFAKYRNSPNVLKFVDLLSRSGQDTQDVLEDILSNDSIDTAAGVVLDFFGGLIGAERPPAQELPENILWLCSDEDYGSDLDGSQSLAPDDLTTGGYMVGDDGILSKTDPGSYMPDADYRELIKAKGSTYRKKATREIVYTYLLQFGVRCKIIESTHAAEFEPHAYNVLNYWVRNYIAARGFRPAGIQVSIKQQTELDSEV
jgi:hypothetical protein